jgi:hypothetical protein
MNGNKNKIYCGNNRLHKPLVNGQVVKGTRYQCLKKGIAIGKNMEPDDMDVDYAPIYNPRIFCGNGNILPDKYKRLGQPYECLQMGIGVGKGIAKKERDKSH